MVDRVTGDNTNPIQQGQLQNRPEVKGVTPQSIQDLEQQLASHDPLIDDQAEISPQAQKLADAVRFGRIVERAPEPFNQDKVSQLKDLVNSGRINEYLRTINTEELAQKILDGPSGNFFKK